MTAEMIEAIMLKVDSQGEESYTVALWEIAYQLAVANESADRKTAPSVLCGNCNQRAAVLCSHCQQAAARAFSRLSMHLFEKGAGYACRRCGQNRESDIHRP